MAKAKARPVKLSRSRIMSIYRSQVKKMHAVKKAPLISQRNVVIGTDNTWFNATVIPRNPAWVPVNNASYVWNSRNLNSQSAIISTTFRLSTRRDILSARLFLSVDNYATVLINGVPVVDDVPQNTPSFFNPGRTFRVGRFLRRGTNDIVIVAFNFESGGTQPAGVAARLNIRLSRLR